MEGIVFDIQRFCVHDGPGIRTTIFLKGCPLHCDWCCNPESQSPFPQPLYDSQKCIGCGSCMEACSREAISLTPTYKIAVETCRDCKTHECVKECYGEALTLAGRAYTVEELLELVERDISFYESSQGGLTLSGGEALLQADFAVELLRQSKERGIHTALETCSACSWESIRRTLPYVDVYLCDVKHTDPDKLRAETGGNATEILEHIAKLRDGGAFILGRIPVIPDFNDKDEEIAAIGRFFAETGIPKVQLLAFHRMGEPKYKKIFKERGPKERPALPRQVLERGVRILQDLGLEASIG